MKSCGGRVSVRISGGVGGGVSATRGLGGCVLSIDVGIRNLAVCKAVVGPLGGVERILAWTVLDLCPPHGDGAATAERMCGRCAAAARPRAVRAAFARPRPRPLQQHSGGRAVATPTAAAQEDEEGEDEDEEDDPMKYLCVPHARQERFGFFPAPTETPAARKRRRKAESAAAEAAFADDGVSADDDDDDEPPPPLPLHPDGGDNKKKRQMDTSAAAAAAAAASTSVDAATERQWALSKSALLQLSLVELKALAGRHAGFADLPPAALAQCTSKAAAAAQMAAHVAARTWRPVRAGMGGGGGGESGAKVSVVQAGMRFALLAQQMRLFEGVAELVIENQLGHISSRMKSMQDVVMCLAVFAGVSTVRAVSAVTKLDHLGTNAPPPPPPPLDGDDGVDTAAQKKRTADALARSIYVAHKKDGIAACRAYMAANPVLFREWTDVFERAKKKDDFADSLLQLLGQIQ